MSGKRKSITSNLKNLDTLTDEEIDYSDIPPLDETFFEKRTVTLPRKKDSITLRIDHDVLAFFKGKGRGYQTLINTVLKVYVQAMRRRRK